MVLSITFMILAIISIDHALKKLKTWEYLLLVLSLALGNIGLEYIVKNIF